MWIISSIILSYDFQDFWSQPTSQDVLRNCASPLCSQKLQRHHKSTSLNLFLLIRATEQEHCIYEPNTNPENLNSEFSRLHVGLSPRDWNLKVNQNLLLNVLAQACHSSLLEQKPATKQGGTVEAAGSNTKKYYRSAFLDDAIKMWTFQRFVKEAQRIWIAPTQRTRVDKNSSQKSVHNQT